MINRLISGVADSKTRNQSADALANYLDCSHLLIFIRDPEIDLLLPAPGFPQTMHLDQRWFDFFQETQEHGVYHGSLFYPDKEKAVAVTGVAHGNEAVGVLLNGTPDQYKLQDFIDLFPLLSRLLIQEQHVLTAETKAFFAEKAALKAEHLTRTIDGMRHLLKEALLKQEQDKQEIEELSRKKDEFINIASHELKTPMTSLKAYIQLLKRGDTGIFPELIATNSLKHMNRLEALVNDLLNVAKLKNGKLTYKMEMIDFAQFMEETVSSLQITSPRHRLIMMSNTPVSLYGDKDRLEQVVTNYITNAVKYSPKADQVLIDSFIEDQHLIVSVRDFGIGIAKEHLDSLFERFYRVDNTASKYEGLGLGLYIASEIVSRHGGTVWIESQLNEGSTFYFKLPINRVVIPENLIQTP
jgi:signal transduction histidine kinase